MQERSIIFSAPMVKALLDGTKAQTRRILRHQPQAHHWKGLPGYRLGHHLQICRENQASVRFWHEIPHNANRDYEPWVDCPYGAPGGRLWVRESWQAWTEFNRTRAEDLPQHMRERINYPANGNVWDARVRSSIHMPRWASRLTLVVTQVRVERLHDISESDARAEGVGSAAVGAQSYREAYAAVWKAIHGEQSWQENPWVWVIDFTRIQADSAVQALRLGEGAG